MEDSTIKFDLVEVVKIGVKWKKHILIFACIISIAVAIYALILKNQYTSYSTFYPSNAVISSRDNLFRSETQDAIDAFGLENEVDRLYVIGNSSPLMSGLISKHKLNEHYDIDIVNDPKGNEKLFKVFAKNYHVSKGAFGNLELTMTDHNTKLAAAVANDAIIAIQDQVRSYYVNSAKGIAEAMDVRMKYQDSIIKLLTDSLVVMRDKYGIYDIISPSRKSDVSTTTRNARGLEEIQTVEELKDKYVTDKAKYESNKNEFLTIQHKSIPFIQVIQYPEPSGKKEGPFRTLMVLGAFAAGLFLGILAAVVIEYINRIKPSFFSADARNR
jgi:capsular polysaccharide biosynthesis protein